MLSENTLVWPPIHASTSPVWRRRRRSSGRASFGSRPIRNQIPNAAPKLRPVAPCVAPRCRPRTSGLRRQLDQALSSMGREGFEPSTLGLRVWWSTAATVAQSVAQVARTRTVNGFRRRLENRWACKRLLGSNPSPAAQPDQFPRSGAVWRHSRRRDSSPLKTAQGRLGGGAQLARRLPRAEPLAAVGA
jgi:hypothetical protein